MKFDKVVIAALIAAATSYTSGCKEEEKKTTPTTPSAASSASATPAPAPTTTSTSTTGGLSLDEQRELYHLPEESLKLLKEKLVYLQRLRALKVTVPGGYGRLDAFVAARNLLWGDKFQMDVSSPVSLPPIYGLSRLSWFHFDNNTTSFIQRNIGEDLGMGAVLDPKTGESEVKVRNLYRLEQLVAKLPIPKWPEAMLGKLDAAKVERGATIYKKECASCHDVGPDGKFPAPRCSRRGAASLTRRRSAT